jgi:hypothetical protein
MGPIGCNETSATIYQATLRNISEERRSQITARRKSEITLNLRFFIKVRLTVSDPQKATGMTVILYVPILSFWTNKGQAERQQQALID